MQIIGHQGASGHAPGNSTGAIRAGLRLGATALQIHVQFAADGTPVLHRDRTLERSAGVRGRIREQTARELSGYDIGFRHGGEHRGLHILTLEEAAAMTPAEVGLHVEIKDYDPVTAEHVRELLRVLQKLGGLDRCEISSESPRILSTVRNVHGGVRRGLRVTGCPKGAARRAASIGCASLCVDEGEASARLVEECSARGLRVYLSAVEAPSRMRSLIDLGVDGLSTGYPERLAALLGAPPEAREKRSSTKRTRRSRRTRASQAAGPEGPEEVARANAAGADQITPPPPARQGARGTRRRRAGRQRRRPSAGKPSAAGGSTQDTI